MQDFCRHCGRKLNGDEMTCPECGAPTDNMPKDSQPYQRSVKSGSSGTNWMPVILVIVIIIAAAAIGLTLLTDTQQPTTSDDLTMNYEWDYKFDNGVTQNYSYTLTVKKADYDAMMKSTIDRTGTTSSEMYKKTDGSTVFGVKDYIVVDDYILALKGELERLYSTTKPAEATDDLASFITCFTQKTIAYDQEEADTGKEYWRFPLETLCSKKGDCEDTAILNTALLYAKPTETSTSYMGGIFLLPGHAMSAVSKDSVSPKVYANEKLGYYPIETACDIQKSIGYLGEEYIGAYFHLYTGYSTAYYQ